MILSKIVKMYERRQDDIVLTGARVIDKMPNNPAFTDPPTALAKLKKILPEFQTSLAHAAGRDKHLVAIKNKKKLIVLDLLEKLAKYVTEKSKGDRAIILSSGFDANRERRKTGIPPAIEKLEVKLGSPGEVTICARNVTGSRGYVHQYTTEPPGAKTQWIGEGSSSKRYTFRGLQSEKRYWFRIIAIGSSRRRAYSPIVTVVIQ
jgi:hypothetical protein